jgi:anti-sigma regulatory factor (Ser/Thr protein kinase)
MNTIPLITSDAGLFDRISAIVKDFGSAEVAWISNADDGLDYLNVELPDLAFINFSDTGNDNFALLDNILKDPWLLHSNIIAYCADHEVADRLEKVRSANIVVPLIDDEAERYLPGILDIVARNSRILFQRTIGGDLVQTISGSYNLENNLVEANCYANLLCNYLFNANRIDAKGKRHINVALTEMLINAIEHGNCGISYEEKGTWLENGGTMTGLIDKKCQDPAVRSRCVTFEYSITPTRSTFVIADQGDGFDWRAVKDPGKHENVQELHGRGIKLTQKYTRNLTYNDKGNEVRFEIEHLNDCTNAVPALFQNVPPIGVTTGTTVFRQGEPGDFLYYIAKGHFDVLVNDKRVARLCPDDIFMGEMSFLLNNRRSATVRATSDAVLIRISKKDFVEAIKQKPQYALFLSRLLAQRIARRNAMERGSVPEV